MDLKLHAQCLSRAIIGIHQHLYLDRKITSLAKDELIKPGAPLDCLYDLDQPYETAEEEEDTGLHTLRQSVKWSHRDDCVYLDRHLQSTDFACPPTYKNLKRHLQALVGVIALFEPAAEGASGSAAAFDWLEKIGKTYSNNEKGHNEPLHALRNSLVEAPTEDLEGEPLPPGETQSGENLECLFMDTEKEADGDRDMKVSVAKLISHTSNMLTLLEDRTRPSGGLLSLLPPQGTDDYEIAIQTRLGNWIHFTKLLVRRLSELENELLVAREVLAGEADVPKQLAIGALRPGEDQPGLGSDGRPLVCTQDQWILCDLTPGLYATLGEKLDRVEQENVRRETASRAQLGGEHRRPLKHMTAWIDVPSRIFRLQGCSTFFVIPGYGVHPNTAELRDMESKPLIQTVPRPSESRAGSQFERELLEKVHSLRASSWSSYQTQRIASARYARLAREMKKLRAKYEPGPGSESITPNNPGTNPTKKPPTSSKVPKTPGGKTGDPTEKGKGAVKRKAGKVDQDGSRKRPTRSAAKGAK